MPHLPQILSRRQLFVLAAAARMKAADEDFGNTKPMADWNAGDLYRLLNHSPWASPAQVWRPAPGHPQPVRNPADARSGNLPPRQEPGPPCAVTWESGQPIREALKTPLPGLFANSYVLGVDGIPLISPTPDHIKRTTVLRSSGKPKWTVKASVLRELIRTSDVYLFAFARSVAPIRPDTKEVTFETQFGPWHIEATFRPKDMLYHGQLAL
jgi:hypothetical protein